MAVDKERLRGLVFAHYEREVQTHSEWNEERKQRELEKLKALYVRRMERNEAGEFLYFDRLEGEELETELARYAADSDPETSERFSDYGSWRKGSRDFREEYENPAEGYLKGLFDGQVDESKLRLNFREKNLIEPFRKLQETIREIGIRTPDGLDDSAIRYAVLGVFLRDDQAFRDSYEQARTVSGSTLPELEHPEDGARSNFFTNVIDGDDERGNMHFNRYAVPSARKKVQEMVRQYPQGGREALAQALYDAFSCCLDRIAGTQYKGRQLTFFCAKTAEKCLELLDREPLKGLVEIPEERRRRAEYFIGEQKNAREAETLREELIESLQKQIIDPSAAKPMADPAFRARAERLLALRYIAESSSDESVMWYAAVNADGREKTQKDLANRDLGVFESLQEADREAFIETIIEKRVRTELGEYETFFGLDTGALLDRLARSPSLGVSRSCNRYLEVFAENMIRGFSEFTASRPDPRYSEACGKMQDAVSRYEQLRRTEVFGLDTLNTLLPAIQSVYDAIDAGPMQGRERERLLREKSGEFQRLNLLYNACRTVLDQYEPSLREIERDKELYRTMGEKGVETPEACRKLLRTAADNRAGDLEKETRERTAEEREAEVWFASFTEELRQRGISFENPLSLGLVKVLNRDFDENAFVDLTNQARTVESSKQILRAAASVSMPAFLPASLRGAMPYQGDDYAGFLKGAVQDPAQLTSAEKLELFRLAKDRRLYLEHPSLEPDAALNFAFAKVQPDGTARLTGFIGDLKVNLMHDPATYTEEDWRRLEESGFERRDITPIQRMGERLTSVKSWVDSAFSECISQLDDQKNAPVEASGNDPERQARLKTRREQQLTAEQKNVSRSAVWQRYGSRISVRAVLHPDWFATEEDRQKQSRLVRASVTPDDLRTPEENELLAQDYTNTEECAGFEKKLMQRFHAASIREVPFDRLTDEAGQAFGNGPDYETMNRLYRAAEQGDVIRIDGVDLIYAGSVDNFIKAAPHERYARQADALLKALKNTDSRFSSDTESYLNFRAGLEALAGQVRDLKNAEQSVNRGYRALGGALAQTAELGRAYQEAHRDLRELSNRQIARLTVIAGIRKLTEQAQEENETPNRQAFDVAFKIRLEQAAVMAANPKNANYAEAKEALLDYDVLKTSAELLAGTPDFQAMMAASNPDDVRRLAQAKPGEAERAFRQFRERLHPPAPGNEPLRPENRPEKRQSGGAREHSDKRDKGSSGRLP